MLSVEACVRVLSVSVPGMLRSRAVSAPGSLEWSWMISDVV